MNAHNIAKMTQEAKAIDRIQTWIDEPTVPLFHAPHMQGYYNGIRAAKEIVQSIINANIKPKKK